MASSLSAAAFAEVDMHELTRTGDRLDVEQDGTGAWIASQVIEEITEVHVRSIAERDAVRETDACALRPIQQRADERPRLCDERDAARARANVRKARVEADAGNEEPDAVWAEDAQPMPRSKRSRVTGRSRFLRSVATFTVSSSRHIFPQALHITIRESA